MDSCCRRGQDKLALDTDTKKSFGSGGRTSANGTRIVAGEYRHPSVGSQVIQGGIPRYDKRYDTVLITQAC